MSKTKDRLIEVEIYGQRYTLRASEDPGYVERVARHVDQKMKALSNQTPTVDSLKVAVLAAVNIADEYFSLVREREDAVALIDEKAREIEAVLDKAL